MRAHVQAQTGERASASRLLIDSWLRAWFMHGAANCVTCAVNCHVEHIACLLSFGMSTGELAFEINGLELFCWFAAWQAWHVLICWRTRGIVPMGK